MKKIVGIVGLVVCTLGTLLFGDMVQREEIKEAVEEERASREESKEGRESN